LSIEEMGAALRARDFTLAQQGGSDLLLQKYYEKWSVIGLRGGACPGAVGLVRRDPVPPRRAKGGAATLGKRFR
jgi:hypothetical protein